MQLQYRCKFGVGLGPDKQCQNAATRISTFQGKRCIGDRGGLVWCDEHHTGPNFTEGHDVEPLVIPGLALSIRQPWAWLITEGHKPFENRDWSPKNPGRKFRGPCLIHAGQGMTRDEYLQGQLCAEDFDITLPPFDKLQRGGIVGVSEVVAWHDSPPPGVPFAFGSGLELRNSKPLPFIACKGMLGFFQPQTTNVTQ